MNPIEVIRRLLEWEVRMGGFDADCWEQARRMISGGTSDEWQSPSEWSEGFDHGD